jgi:hypothetical protein
MKNSFRLLVHFCDKHKVKLFSLGLLLILVIFAELGLRQYKTSTFGVVTSGALTFIRYTGQVKKLIEIFPGYVLNKSNEYVLNKSKEFDIPHFDLIFSEKNKRHFKALTEKLLDDEVTMTREGIKKHNVYRKIEVKYNGTNISAKVRLHGGGSSHWRFKKQSFRLKFKKNNQLMGMRKVGLIVPEDRGFIPPLFYRSISKAVGLPYVDNGYATVSINGTFIGFYIYEEDIDNNISFFEKNELPNNYTLRGSEYIVHDFKQRAWSEKATDIESPFNEQILAKFKQLLNAIDREDTKKVLSMLDLEKTAAFEAIRAIKGSHGTHDFVEENLRLAYSAESGKFYFLVRVETPTEVAPVVCTAKPDL